MRTSFLRTVSAVFLTGAFALSSLGQIVGFDTSNLDREVSPCTDFYQYAKGSWLERTEIPASEARWGTFNILAERNNIILREVLDAAVKNPGKKGSDTQLIGDFYGTCMDEAAIERAGTKPIDPFLSGIQKISNVRDLQRQIAKMHDSGIPAIFSFGAGSD